MDNLKQKLWEAALNTIKLRIHSKKELHDKLLKKFPQADEPILKVMSEMERVHLLSDRQFTQEFVNHLTQKNIGRLKLFHETRKKGLENETVEQALFDINWSEEESCKKAINEKNRVLREDSERKKKQKLINFLKNRGFTTGAIFKVTKES